MGDMKQRSPPSPAPHPLLSAIDPPGPLHDVAWWIGRLGSRFWHLWNEIKNVPLFGRFLAWPFYEAYERCYWAAHYLTKADERIESLGWDEFIWSPGAWLLVRLGADIGHAVYWRYAPWGWIIWKFRKEHPILDALLARDFRWVWDYLRGRFPILKELTDDPGGLIWKRIKDRWSWVDELIFYPGRWLLVKLGADIGHAEYYRDRPWAWLIWKFRKEHPPLDALLARDTAWLFNWFREAIDSYIDLYVPWLVSTGTRLLNIIWQMRL